VTYQSASAATQWTTSGSNISYNSGSVGIGTNVPTSALTVVCPYISNTQSYICGRFLSTNVPNNTPMGQILLGESASTYNSAEIRMIKYGTDSPTNFLGLGLWNNADRLVITGSGNVGIGTTDPKRIFHIYSTTATPAIMLSGSSSPQIIFGLPYSSGGNNYYNVILTDIGSGLADGPLCVRACNPSNYGTLQWQNASSGAMVNSLSWGGSYGYVGIGTNSPQFPLEVVSSINWSTGYQYQVYSLGMPAGTEQVYSVRASYSFWTFYGGYLSSSDRRKKTNISNADTSTALSKILSLPLKTYNYIDKVADGDELVYGLIAQEVKEIMPEAITLGTGNIPSIYKMATSVELSEDEINVIITVDIPETAELKVGGKVQLVVEDMKEKHTTTVVSFTSYELVVPKWDDFDETKNVFVVGPEINDYHTLDKPYLAVVCMGGIQELSKRNDALTARVTALETTNTTLQQQIATLNQLVSSLIDKVNNLSQ
jgi:hypothetical protein